jgi:DNA invertase Pin-like site-specific DNA recombinase
MGPLLAGREEKIQGRHFERLAVVYVRQSTIKQVQRNQESTRHQYSLVQLAERLGWPRERIVVIDDDQGMSGASSEKRHGFQRLLSEVALDHVGLILGVEMSRLARSCKDWYQLLEICALFGTLICDLDGLYDPSAYNDRLLLGLKGTMSEAELHVLKQRMRQGSLQKARRGELVNSVPRGYVRDRSGRVSFDPDEQVQTTIKLVFEQFERIGSVQGVLRHFVECGVQLPGRAISGPNKGALEWRPPRRAALQNILAHPMYAGAYVYGRRRERRGADSRRSQRSRRPRQEWHVLLRDRYPAYISWEQFERNVARIRENYSRFGVRGSVRKGRALLAGILVCGRCGHHLATQYPERDQPRYACSADRTSEGAPRCQALGARALDEEVTRLLLAALSPSALEVSLAVAADLQSQREQADLQWRQRIERAEYEAERARRQHDAVEPENRLVARALETAWEGRLLEQREVMEKYDRFLQEQPKGLAIDEQDRIRRLASDLPALWNAETTTDADRKQILREVIDKVVVNVEGESEWVEARVYWAGGQETYTRFRRPVQRMEQLASWPQLQERVRELKADGCTAAEMARILNEEGFRATRGKPLNKAGIRALMSRHGLSAVSRDKRKLAALGPDEWLIGDLCERLRVSKGSIYRWVKSGQLAARQAGGPQGFWIVTAGAEKVAELSAARCRQEKRRQYHECSSKKAKV